jgi:hypothetical protein
MAIARTALGLAGLDDHLGRLTAAVSESDSKSFAEPECPAFHVPGFRFALQRTTCNSLNLIAPF